MGFKTVDRYDDEENYTGFFNGPAFARKKLEERFDEMEKIVRGWSKEERITAGQNTVYSFVEFIDTNYSSPDYTSQQFVITFIACATELGFAGLDPLPKAKIHEVAEILEVIGDKDAILENDQFFDWKQFRDKDHQMLVDNFFGICPEPLLQEYPLWLLSYMLIVCCADKVNENGIKAARKVWIDYLDVLDKRKHNPNYVYTGTYDRAHFRNAQAQKQFEAEQKAKEEEIRKRREAEAEKRKKKEEEERKKKEEKERKRKEEKEGAKKERVEQLQKKAERIWQLRRDRDEGLEEVRKSTHHKIEEQQTQIASWKTELQDAKDYRSSLGFFSFSLKREAASKIKMLNGSISEAEKKIQNMQEALRQSEEKINEEYKCKCNNQPRLGYYCCMDLVEYLASCNGEEKTLFEIGEEYYFTKNDCNNHSDWVKLATYLDILAQAGAIRKVTKSRKVHYQAHTRPEQITFDVEKRIIELWVSILRTEEEYCHDILIHLATVGTPQSRIEIWDAVPSLVYDPDMTGQTLSNISKCLNTLVSRREIREINMGDGVTLYSRMR